MADRGAIGGNKFLAENDSDGVRCPVQPYAQKYIGPGVAIAMLRQDGLLGGSVTEVGSPLANVRVLIYWWPSGLLIAGTMTDANGDWQLSGFDPTNSNNYAVVYQDKAGGTVYNDAIYALVAPVA